MELLLMLLLFVAGAAVVVDDETVFELATEPGSDAVALPSALLLLLLLFKTTEENGEFAADKIGALHILVHLSAPQVKINSG